MLAFSMIWDDCASQIDVNTEQIIQNRETEAAIDDEQCLCLDQGCIISSDESENVQNDAEISEYQCIVFTTSESSNNSRISSLTQCHCESMILAEYEYIPEGEESHESLKIYPKIKEKDKKYKDEQDVECTLAIIKPEAVVSRKEIERRIYEEGFEVLQMRWLQLTPEQASEFYKGNYSRADFASLIAYMTSGSIIVMVLARNQAIENWKRILGPTKVSEARSYYPESLRAKYGSETEDMKNVVHGSDNQEQAEKEIHFFFPNFIIEPLLTKGKTEEYLWEKINVILIQGLIQCCESKPVEPILWLANWLITNNPNKPKLPENLTLIPM